MQAWAKRGLQTALVTGGLLMLGTGIASADEDVNPDKPASPLDFEIRVPIRLDNNAIATPFRGQQSLPEFNREVSVNPGQAVSRVPVVNGAVPAAVAKARAAADELAGPALDRVTPVTDRVSADAEPLRARATEAARPLTSTAEGVLSKTGLPGHLPEPKLPSVPRPSSAFEGNSISGDVIAPVDVSGNAVAVFSEARVVNYSYQHYENREQITTSGNDAFLAGNAADLDYTVPVQITGNAGAVGGRAIALNRSHQAAVNTTDILTDGSDGALSGNAGVVQGATPVQVTGNALAGAGEAKAVSMAETSAESGGWVRTTGEDGVGTGNVAGVPVATPLRLNGNGVAGLGEADTIDRSTADATAGGERPGLYNMQTYLQSNGSDGIAAGNVVSPSASGPVMACGNAAAGVGDSQAACSAQSTTDAGGVVGTTGERAVLSGSGVTPAVVLPVSGFGNAGAAVGEAEALANSKIVSTAGGGTYTRGHDSVLSGTTATSGVSGPVEVFSTAATGVGEATAGSINDVSTTAGGNTGTTGDDSVGGGNMVTAPITTPVETFGNTVAGAGDTTVSAKETKRAVAGGISNTIDDNGLLASNLVTAPFAGAAQAFGNGAAVAGTHHATAIADNTAVAGGDNFASGVGGIGSANIAQITGTVPAQVSGTGANAAGTGDQLAVSENRLISGGDSTSDGTDSLLSGNVVNTPAGAAAQGFGESVAALGLNRAIAASDTESTTGGSTDTTGVDSFGSGNVVAPQLAPVAQSFAAVVSGVGGQNSSAAANENDVDVSGDIDTNGDRGVLSGNIADVPAAAVAQPFGDAVAAVGSESFAAAVNDSDTEVGGTSTTSGEWGSLSGIDGTVPVGANVPVYDVPVGVLAQAIAQAFNDSEVEVGEGSELDIPVSGNGTAPTSMPSLMPLAGRSMARDLPVPADQFTGAFTGVLDGFGSGLGAGSPAHPFLPVSGDLFGDMFGGLTDGGLGLASADLPMIGDLFGSFSGLPSAQVPSVPALPEMDSGSLTSLTSGFAGLTDPIN